MANELLKRRVTGGDKLSDKTPARTRNAIAFMAGMPPVAQLPRISTAGLEEREKRSSLGKISQGLGTLGSYRRED